MTSGIWPSQLWEKIWATSPCFMGWASQIHSSPRWRKSAGWVPAECHLFSRAASLPCWGFKPPDWQMCAAGLLRTSSGLHSRSSMPLFFSKFLPAPAKGVRVWHVSCKPLSTLQGERFSGEMPENSTHQSRWSHPISLSALGKEGKPETSSFPRHGPKMSLPTRHAPLHKLASYVAAGAWRMTRSCFSMASVEEGTRKFLACSENLSVYIFSQLSYYILVN